MQKMWSGQRNIRRAVIRGMAAACVVAGVLLAVGVYLDYRSFDQTRGGYDAPYTGWTGTPIDWEAAERTEDGFRQNGRIVNSSLDCTTGMISFDIAGISIEYRTVSDRAIAVHAPREACEREGFNPRF